MNMLLTEFENLPENLKQNLNPVELKLIYPDCFKEKYCHIKRIANEKIYSEKNKKLICNGCLWK